MSKFVRQTLLYSALLVACASQLYAQGTAFTYQGRLNDGANLANGTYDLRFTTFNAVTNGSATSVSVTNPAVAISNGLFTVILDFGNGPFAGSPQWLDVGVRTNGASLFTALAPRPLLTATPYAIMAGSASNLVGVLPGSQVLTNFSPSGVYLSGTLGGTFTGYLQDLTNELPTTLKNVYLQIATPLNLGGGTNLNASQITGGTWTNASLNYAYKSFFTNYAITTSDVVLNCRGTNQVITLLPAANFPPSTLLTIWSDNANGSVIITNGTGFEAITVPGQGQGLAVLLGPANSPSNSVTLMVHGGHW
jgi:hypothetical protein